MRLRQLREEIGPALTLRWRAFPLRPVPDATATFAGTYREAAWRRCQDLAADTGVTYRMWTRPDYPQWSMPALEAAKCVALQGEPLFEAAHLQLYCAFFERRMNLGRPEEVRAALRDLPGLDGDRFAADYAQGVGRRAVLDDYERAVREHRVRGIPTVILPDGRAVVGAVPLDTYRRALGR